MVECITLIRKDSFKGGVSLGDFLSPEDAAKLGISKASMKEAMKSQRRIDALQREQREIEEEMRRR